MRERLFRWLEAGCIAGLLPGILDSAVLYMDARQMFHCGKEMLLAMGLSIAVCALGGISAGLCGFAAHFAIFHGAPRQRLWRTAMLFAPLFIWLFWLLSCGPKASAIPGRIIIVGITGVVAAVISTLAILRGAAISFKRNRLLAALGCLLGGIGMVFADLTILVHLYAPFHIALTVCAWLLFSFSWLLFQKKPIAKHAVLKTGLPVAALAIIGYLSLNQITGTQNIRFVIGEKTATASDVVDLHLKMFPPQEIPLSDDSRVQKTKTHTTDQNKIDAPETSIDPFIPQQQLKIPGASVIIITIDAMRHDRLQPGNTDKTSPCPSINALAQKSVIFERAYTPYPNTTYAVASLLTGKYMASLFPHPDVGTDNEVRNDAHNEVHKEVLPEILERNGYRTGGFFSPSAFYFHPEEFEALKARNYGFGHLKSAYHETTRQKVNQVLTFLAQARKRHTPIFAWLHLLDPHAPYDENCTRFGVEDEQRYDCEIYAADKEIKRLLSYVNKFYPKTIIVVTSDHGEEFNEHGGRFHSSTLYDEQARVPLVMHIPGVSFKTINEPVNLVDIPGTVLSLLDIPVPPKMRSQNLVRLILGLDTKKKAAFSQLSRRRMVVFDSHKLIWNISTKLLRLYDLRTDPRETISITEQKPEVVKRLKRKIEAWQASNIEVELGGEKDDREEISKSRN